MRIKTKTAAEWKAVPATNRIAAVMEQARSHLRRTFSGMGDGIILFGGSGIGKNHLVHQVASECGVEPLRSDPSSYHDVLRAFHEATHGLTKPRPVFFDEAELIFNTVKNINILKTATSTIRKDRYHADYTWWSEEEEETGDEIKIKKVKNHGTSLDAPIIALTNKNLHDFNPKEHQHFNALFSRIQPIHIPDDPIAAWEYTVHLALTSQMMTVPVRVGKSIGLGGASLSARVRAVEWFTANLHNLSQVSPRTLQNAARTITTSDMIDADLALMLVPEDRRTTTPIVPQHDWQSIMLAM